VCDVVGIVCERREVRLEEGERSEKYVGIVYVIVDAYRRGKE
jgi:hypothetical protein